MERRVKSILRGFGEADREICHLSHSDCGTYVCSTLSQWELNCQDPVNSGMDVPISKVFFLAGLWVQPRVQAGPPGVLPLLMVGDPVSCCLGRAKGEKVKYECIVEFSKMRCENELDVMKPAEILCGEACLYQRDNNFLLVLQFPQSCHQELHCCCRDGSARQGTSDQVHAKYPKPHSLFWVCHRCQVYLVFCIV